MIHEESLDFEVDSSSPPDSEKKGKIDKLIKEFNNDAKRDKRELQVCCSKGVTHIATMQSPNSSI